VFSGILDTGKTTLVDPLRASREGLHAFAVIAHGVRADYRFHRVKMAKAGLRQRPATCLLDDREI